MRYTYTIANKDGIYTLWCNTYVTEANGELKRVCRMPLIEGSAEEVVAHCEEWLSRYFPNIRKELIK
jgi:hypothetical protein